VRDEFERAVEMGRQNAEMISLGKAWCTHIRNDRGPLGVGMLEQQTGLPVTGGRFTCDYARNPVHTFGMELAVSALDFYQHNCKGCPYRAPGNRVPNLSTWAEPQLAERERVEQERQAAAQALRVDRERRAAHRRMVAAQLPAAAQSLVELVNRLDGNGSDAEAAESLTASARLTPEAFAREVQEILLIDAAASSSSAIVDALVSLDEAGVLSDSPRLRTLACRAMEDGWGRQAAARYLLRRGEATDLNPRLTEALIHHAAPTGLFQRSPGEPALLLHYHDLVPEAVEAAVRSLLVHGEAGMRADAAASADQLAARDPSAGVRLLSALLDGLKFLEDPFDHAEASGTLAEVVTRILTRDPAMVDAAVGGRWDRATPAYKGKLLRCYRAAMYRSADPLPEAVATVVIGRAVTALSEDSPSVEEFEDDFQRVAAELLSQATRQAEALPEGFNVLLGLLLIWLDRLQAVSEDEPQNPEEALRKIGDEARYSVVVREVRDAVVAAGRRSLPAFLSACREAWEANHHAPRLRAELVKIAARAAQGSYEHLGEVLPMIYTAMLTEDQEVRAEGMAAAEGIVRDLEGSSVPPLLTQAVIAGLTDQYLIVVRSAVDAVLRMPVDVADRGTVIMRLIQIASAYAEDRLRHEMVDNALAGALQFAADDENLLRIVRRVALMAIDRMPRHEARDTLAWFPTLKEDPIWADVSVRALHPDDDPRYHQLGQREEDEILQALTRHELTDTQLEALARTGQDVSRHDPSLASRICDTLSELGRPDLAGAVATAVLEQVANTIEQRGRRRAASLRVLRLELEEAIRTGDPDRQQGIVTQAAEQRRESGGDQ
jgi:hypothetical protein